MLPLGSGWEKRFLKSIVIPPWQLGRPSLHSWILGSFESSFWPAIGPWFWMVLDAMLFFLASQVAISMGQDLCRGRKYLILCAHITVIFEQSVCLNEKHIQDLIGFQISLTFKAVRVELITNSPWAMNLFASWSYEHHNPPGACHGAFTTCFSHESWA